jgi:hypothetical protein
MAKAPVALTMNLASAKIAAKSLANDAPDWPAQERPHAAAKSDPRRI